VALTFDRSVVEDAADDPKLGFLRGLRSSGRAARRIVLRYLLWPVAIHGRDRVEVIEFQRSRADRAGVQPTDRRELIQAGLLLSSIGYRGTPIAGLPFDGESGTIPHDRGRVLDPVSGTAVPGTYVVGWIKRGPNGFIGTNRGCAQDTVEALVEDFNRGALNCAPGAADGPTRAGRSRPHPRARAMAARS
jgi:ferredoxin--NADP+ reductase